MSCLYGNSPYGLDGDRLQSTIIINVRAERLRDRDIVGHSDAFAVLYIDSRVPLRATDGTVSLQGITAPQPEIAGGPRDKGWERIGMTETIANNCNPRFSRSFNVPYFFERAQRLAIDFYDRDNPEDEPFDLHDFLGTAECSIPTLVRSRGKRLQLELKDTGRPELDCGYVYLVAEEDSELKQLVELSLETQDLKLGMFSPRSELPLLTISRPVTKDSSEWIVVHGPVQSVRTRQGMISFGKCEVNHERLCFRDDDIPLQVDILGRKGASVGTANVTLNKWRANPVLSLTVPPVVSPTTGRIRRLSRLGFQNHRPVGHLVLKDYGRRIRHSFLDYVGGGYQISLVLAVDFTASNGDPSKPGSLHHIDQYKHNEYEMAIEGVGEILAQYDTDDCYPAYGFGAKLPPQFRQPSHCFTLNGSDDATCVGIDGVLDAYRNCLLNVRFGGPTIFSEIIRAAVGHVQEEKAAGSQNYTIMLIITDGVINDFDETVDEIVRASSLPFSIVIVGVGDAEFAEMDQLDSDDQLLRSSTGHASMRDIVQFVSFRKYHGAPEVLAGKVLEEIPEQFLSYMEKHNIEPPSYVEDPDDAAELEYQM